MLANDTIVAISTATGKAGIGIVRISGSLSFDIGTKMTGIYLKPRCAYFSEIKDLKGDCFDKGIVIYFKAPHSYTGEDVVEFHAHGGIEILQLILKIVISYGVRLANAGEFTERAYLNNKIDLVQAEAVVDMINATSKQAIKSSILSLQGVFSKKLYDIVAVINKLRIYIEAVLNFPDDNIDLFSDNYILNCLKESIFLLKSILYSASQGILLRDGIQISILGKPNSGKSSLLNSLLGSSRAIVTNVAGTTRDTVSDVFQIEGTAFHIIDTAGLRNTNSYVENEGIRRSLKTIMKSNYVLIVLDISESFLEKQLNTFSRYFSKKTIIIYIYNKVDLQKNRLYCNHNNILYLSAKFNTGIAKLRDYLLKVVGYVQDFQGTFSARQRHIHLLEKTLQYLESAKNNLKNLDVVFLAEDLYMAQLSLSNIIGKVSSDDLLGEIFSTFCIGK